VRRFREEGGLLTKNVTYTYKQVTEILNSRDEPAVITFVDQVPKSQDEKLKVCGYCRKKYCSDQVPCMDWYYKSSRNHHALPIIAVVGDRVLDSCITDVAL